MKLADDVLTLVSGPLSQVEKALAHELSQAAPEVKPILLHLMESGGKRVRPIVTLLSTQLFHSNITPAIPVAVAAELIHMATLVHDDVIDTSATRRGRPTVNAVWGNQTAVLAGDALLARALVMLVDTGNPTVVKVMADMIRAMCEGEIVQNATLRDIDQTEADYLERIEKKTALFFAACCQCGALMGGGSAADAAAMWQYGRLVGLAFQVVDDLLDVGGTAAVVGKPVGNDLASGVLTLPVIYTMQHSPNKEAVRNRIQANSISAADVVEILDIVKTDGAIDYTRGVAASLVKQAQQVIPPGEPGIRDLLIGIAELVTNRAF